MKLAEKFVFITFISVSQLFNIALAQSSDSVKTYVVPETVVTGTRIEEDQNKLPVSITVINSNEIEKSADVNVLPAINNAVPGLFLNNRNILGYGVGPVSSGEISIRGIGENPNTGILVLVDGQPQFMGIFGHPINDTYLKENIERIEVIRGPASLLYGSNAVGGAINLITRKLRTDGLSLHSSLTYGSFNTSVFSGTGGYKNHNLNFITAYTYSNTDGSRKDGDDNYKSNSLFSRLAYDFTKEYSLNIDANLIDSKFYDPGPESAPRINNYYNYTRGRIALSLENFFSSENAFPENARGALRLYYNYGKHNFFDGWNSTDNFAGVSLYQSVMYSGQNIFTAGIEYKNYGGRGENKNTPPQFAIGLNKDLSINEAEAYGIFQYLVITNLNLSAGLRATKNSIYGFEYTPEFGFSFIPDNTTIIRGNAGKAFRNPTIADLFLFPVSNEDLKPEKLWSYEIGISKYLAGNLIKSELTFFYLKTDNLIQQLSPPFSQKINTGSFNNKGIEFNFSLLPVHRFSANLVYSYLNTSKVLLYAPEHKLNVHCEYNFGIFTLTSDLQSISGLYPGTESAKENYTTLSVGANSSLNRNLSLFAKASNLTNKKYYIDEGYPSPGLYFLTGVRLSFDGI